MTIAVKVTTDLARCETVNSESGSPTGSSAWSGVQVLALSACSHYGCGPPLMNAPWAIDIQRE